MQDLWDVFTTTGRVADYLAFKGSAKAKEESAKDRGGEDERSDGNVFPDGHSERESWDRI